MTKFINFNFLRKSSTFWRRWPDLLVAGLPDSSHGMETISVADLYAILQIQRSASQYEIRGAYRKLAKSLHPDIGKSGETDEEQLKKVNAAYRILGNPDHRERYDRLWRARQKSELKFGGKHGVRLRAVILSFAPLISLTAGISTAYLWFKNFEGGRFAGIENVNSLASRQTGDRSRSANSREAGVRRTPTSETGAPAGKRQTHGLSNTSRDQPGVAHLPSIPPPEEARRHADHMAWLAAEREGTRTALTSYLHAHPEGGYASQARNKLAFVEGAERVLAEEDAAWAIAVRQNTPHSYSHYLQFHPRGRHVGTALERLSVETAVMRTSAVSGQVRRKRNLPILNLPPLKNISVQSWPSAHQPIIEPEIGYR